MLPWQIEVDPKIVPTPSPQLIAQPPVKLLSAEDGVGRIFRPTSASQISQVAGKCSRPLYNQLPADEHKAFARDEDKARLVVVVVVVVKVVEPTETVVVVVVVKVAVELVVEVSIETIATTVELGVLIAPAAAFKHAGRATEAVAG
jgi:hypothetical protein